MTSGRVIAEMIPDMRICRNLLLISILGVSGRLATGQPAPGVDPKQVDAAVDRAGEFLLSRLKEGRLSVWLWGGKTSEGTRADELVLYTLLYAGAPKNHPDFQKTLQRVLSRGHIDVYRTAVCAMLLSELDREKHQARIALCAQFLVDAQCANGQWGYDGPAVAAPSAAPPEPATTLSVSAAPPAKPAGGPPRTATRALKPVTVRRGKTGAAAGNNSTTQIALLGLRACLEANVRIPNATLALAESWWRKNQNDDGGWGYGDNGAKGGSYGSMTAGAIGSLAICDFYQRKDPKTDRDLIRGAKWFEEDSHWSLDHNPKLPQYHHYYWLYALERAGILVGTKTIANRPWYAEGAKWLLAKQAGEGNWNHPEWVEDTCWAVLFLRRATRPLTKVYSPQ